MTWLEVASIAAGLAIGYWLVTVFTHRPDDADIGMPPPDAVVEASGARPWHEVLEVSEWASDEEVTAAYRGKITQYHPDKVATLGAEIRALAALKAREINDAYNSARRRH